ncbi:hypothetical protein BDZ97DRAFT_1808194 [Flammula alnicola]|nr:hypothetical protein BDZ97DRAFT_1808194 [Flammula alnicola]
MSQDVNDPDKRGRRRSASSAFRSLQVRSPQLSEQAALFSKIRNLNNLALTSIGSLFSGPPLSRNGGHLQNDGTAESDTSWPWRDKLEGAMDTGCEDEDLTPLTKDYCYLRAEDYCAAKALNGVAHSVALSSDSIRSPEIGRSGSSQAHISTRFPEVRRFFGGISRSRRATYQDENTAYGALYPTNGPAWSAPCSKPPIATSSPTLPSDSASVSLPAASSLGSVSSTRSGNFETPPLTPDSFNNHALPSSGLSLSRFDSSFGLDALCSSGVYDNLFPVSPSQGEQEKDDEDDNVLYTGPNLLEVKEGKKPERRINETDSIPRDTNPGEPATNSPALVDDQAEWYGLEYTLELSSRERQPSDTQSISAGEHSRSHESWAAIHQGRIHPFFEDEDYLRWKNWHRFLDRQDEKKRHRKGLEFKARSKDMAWLFAEEIRIRDVLYWQQERYGVVARDIKERLQYITERRPDPFFPPKRHHWGWYLKRSRSLGCLRELKPNEVVTADENAVSQK